MSIVSFFYKHAYFLSPLVYRVFHYATRIFHNGVRVMEEDWNYLIVLDACRYDYFKEVNMIKGTLLKKRSLGSHTKEWARKNFTGWYPDTVYFSSNPIISEYMLKELVGKQPFFKIFNLWATDWDEKLGTVKPESVNKRVLEHKDDFPDKRIIIHYLQPHLPYILTKFPDDRKIIKKENLFFSYSPKLWDNTVIELKERVKRGEVDIELIKQAYKKDLQYVLGYVKKLIRKLKGKIIVTSDHGNCFGEWGLYWHPIGIYVKPLVEIPWLIVEK